MNVNKDVSHPTILKNSDYEILDKDGNFQNFDGLVYGESSKIIEFTLSNNIVFETTHNHTFIINDKEKLAKNLKQYDYITEDLYIKDIKYLNKNTEVFDVLNVENTNSFKTYNSIDNHNCILWDESAFIRDSIARQFYNSIYPIVGSRPNGKLIIISTPNGVFNLFHELWIKAENKKNRYASMKITWKDVPGRDEEWKKEQLENMSEEDFNQEYDCSFNSNMQTIINKTTLEYISSCLEDPIKTEIDGKLRIYEERDNNSKYILGVDPSKGTGQHDATIQIYRIESLKPIKLINTATFQSNTTNTFDLTAIINRLSIYYNDGYIAIENNGEGSAVSQNLWWVYENPNLYNSGQTEQEIGIRATRATKPTAVVTMKKLLEDKSLIVKDAETAKQLSTFKEKGNNKFGTINDEDDLVSALYWVAYLVTTEIFDDIEIVKTNTIDDDTWGILSDIDDDYYIEEFKW